MSDDVVRDIPEDMVEAGTRALVELHHQWDELTAEELDEVRGAARLVLAGALAGRTIVELPDNSTEQQWQVTVSVPMRLDVVMRQALFESVVSAVAAWEPDDRDEWDADVFGQPAPPPGLADDLREWADTLARGTGTVPAVDVAWKLRRLADGHPVSLKGGEQ